MTTTATTASPRRIPFLYIALGVALAVRLLISTTNIPKALKNEPELSSPLTSFRELKEGVYLFNNGIDPYSGGSFRHSPLLLSLFTTVLPISERGASVLWALVDAVAAWCLVQIWRVRQNRPDSVRDGLVLLAYLLNPYLFLPSTALSTSSLDNAVLLAAILAAAKRRTSLSLLFLAFLFHLSISSIILLLPIALLILGRPTSQLASPRPSTSNLRLLIPLFLEYWFYVAILSFISTLVAGSWTWIPQTWGATLTLPDLTPNTGLWWYFFTEMFDHYRPFFLVVFNAHLLIYAIPVCIKFQYDPLFATFVMAGIFGTFKAYTTLSDPGLFISMIAIFPEIYPYLRHPIVTVLLHLHAALLMPLFRNLWVKQGTGNANFFYATTLVFACANGAALLDCIWAGLRIAIGPPNVDGYTVVQE